MYDYKGFIYGEDSVRHDEWLKQQNDAEILKKGKEVEKENENSGFHEQPRVVEGKITESHTHDEF